MDQIKEDCDSENEEANEIEGQIVEKADGMHYLRDLKDKQKKNDAKMQLNQFQI